MLSVGDSVTDNTFEESLEDTAGFFVDHGGDTLDASTTRETTDGGLGDALDVVTQNLAVTLRAAFAEAFATFSACWVCQWIDAWMMSRGVGDGDGQQGMDGKEE